VLGSVSGDDEVRAAEWALLARALSHAAFGWGPQCRSRARSVLMTAAVIVLVLFLFAQEAQATAESITRHREPSRQRAGHHDCWGPIRSRAVPTRTRIVMRPIARSKDGGTYALLD
jgi:hypothetical protein